MQALARLEPAIYGLWGRRANHYTTRNNTIFVWYNYNRFYLHKGWFCPWVVVNVSFLAGRNRVKSDGENWSRILKYYYTVGI